MSKMPEGFCGEALRRQTSVKADSTWTEEELLTWMCFRQGQTGVRS